MPKPVQLVTVIVLVSVLFGAVSAPAQPAQAAGPVFAPAAPTTPPKLMVNQPFSHWAVGGYFLYWSACDNDPALAASASPAADDGYLRRLPTGFGRITYMNVTSFCADHFAADDSGLYAYTSNQDIVKRLVDAPYTSVLVHHTSDAPTIPLVLVGDQIYWASSTHIYRVNKDGSGAVTIATDTHGTPLPNLVVFGSSVAWLAGGYLWRVSTACGSPPCGEAASVIPAQGGSLVRHVLGVIWRDGTTTPQTIQKLDNVELCYSFPPSGCTQTPIYTGAVDTHLGAVALSGSQIFFVENECADPPFCTPTTTGRVRRVSVDGGAAVTIAQDVPNFGDQLYASGCCVYFEQSPPMDRRKIARLPVDATPLIHNLEANAWEVTQAIQGLSNDVPLVANKPTYVRVYGLQLDGPRANTVEAAVYGWVNGTPLPGSPLWPMEGRSRSLVTGASFSRLTNDGWLFQLPDAWTNAGSITLQVKLDPRGVYDDPDLTNNALPNAAYPTGTFNFIAKSPVCIVAVPVRTHGPVASSSGANYWAAIGMIRRMYPTSQVWTYQQADDIAEREFDPFPTFGPYEIPEDSNGMIQSLMLRSQFSDDPDECDDSNARTHYIGIVSPETPTGNANVDLGTNGTGLVGYAQA